MASQIYVKQEKENSRNTSNIKMTAETPINPTKLNFDNVGASSPTRQTNGIKPNAFPRSSTNATTRPPAATHPADPGKLERRHTYQPNSISESILTQVEENLARGRRLAEEACSRYASSSGAVDAKGAAAGAKGP
eukprot:CAMPEP_0118946074 /NCGR_PEP_ID=MMETSP1169-20130426/43529_1 /TAXON_ID=36882 /ORGANISM="Pyramimonas obovata, Strain CCMP722" /LENGTH=134 /DNA_ID=CAMNT_0006891959 /DNA_START=127 /DNA_END=528 /DNA_ORIENTATION=-